MKIDLNKTQRYLEWMNQKLYLDAIADKAACRKVRRGEVYWCHFGLNIGSEISKNVPRPAVIVQKDGYNISSPNTIVVPITHSQSNMSCLIPFDSKKDSEGKIILDGRVNVSGMTCVSKSRLGDMIGKLEQSEVKEIDAAIARQLDLFQYYHTLKDQSLNDKKYIQQLKRDRNELQDILNNITLAAQTENIDDIICTLKTNLYKFP